MNTLDPKLQELSPSRQSDVMRFKTACELVVNTQGMERKSFYEIMKATDLVMGANSFKIAYPNRGVK